MCFLCVFSNHSDFKESARSLKDLENLPTYGAKSFLDDEIPSLSEDSPLIVLQSLLKMLLELISINKQLVVKVSFF